MLRRTLGLALLTLVAVGCAPTTASPAGPTPTPDSTSNRLIGRATVIDSGSAPWLCFGVLTSLPPQCGGGVELVDWRWPEAGVERSGSTTWGDFAVVGRFDGRRFRVEKTVDPDTAPQPDGSTPDFSSPCPAPAGGWRAPDPGRATYETQDQAARVAEALPGYGDLWIDDLGGTAQDPARLVLNISVTDDLAGAERSIRRVWGGALCVSKAERTSAELNRIQRELEKTPHLLSSSYGFGHVDLTVVFDDGSLQQRLDRTYGPGLVRVDSALQPYLE